MLRTNGQPHLFNHGTVWLLGESKALHLFKLQNALNIINLPLITYISEVFMQEGNMLLLASPKAQFGDEI